MWIHCGDSRRRGVACILDEMSYKSMLHDVERVRFDCSAPQSSLKI
jgi:hypothetical protein